MTAAAAMVVGLTPPPARATPPNVPTHGEAVTRLAALTVAAEGSPTAYDRGLFPHWITISDSCNTREEVLRRDGTNVVVSSTCAAISGSWYSPYDGMTWTLASDIDIDHMVPLAEAWASGAWAWTTAKRRSYANDLGGPQLWAVTDNVNQSKGNKDPAEWQPPLTSFRCTYARAWIQVKYDYSLTMDTAEKAALQDMLTSC
ncbi:HNH endonuclease family protein [Luedemannella helvata]